MSSVNKKKLILNTVSVSLGCNSCKNLKLTSFFNPKPKTKPKPKPQSRSYKRTTHRNSSSECETPTSFTPSSESNQYWDVDTETDKETKCSTATVRGFGRVGGESVAVEKDSDDPYLDFRYSMLQMILEKEIYSKDDLKELLNCFLKLNSPYHHEIIVRAFTEIWNGVFSIKPRSGASPKLHFGIY